MRIRTTAILAALSVALPAALAASPARAQDSPSYQTADTPYASYNAGNVDTVDNYSGNITLNIPLATYPQKDPKLNFSVYLHYHSGPAIVTLYCDMNGNCTSSGPTYASGWSFVESPGVQDYQFSWGGDACYNSPPGNCFAALSDQEVDVTHQFAPTTSAALGAGPNVWRAVDGSGQVINWSQANYLLTVTDANGVTSELESATGRRANYGTQWGPLSVSDTHGNTIQANLNAYGYVQGWTDTMGRTIPETVSGSTSVCPSVPGAPAANGATLWNLPGPAADNGGVAPVTICWTTVNESYSYYDSYEGYMTGGGPAYEVQSVVLPNGKAWEMTYDDMGDILTATLPTGGALNYTWNTNGPVFCDAGHNGNDVLDCFGSTLATRTLTTNDGTAPDQKWTYSYSNGLTTVTDLAGNSTTYAFDQLDYYSPYLAGVRRCPSGGQCHNVFTTFAYKTPFDGDYEWPLYQFAVDVVPTETDNDFTLTLPAPSYYEDIDSATADGYDNSFNFYFPEYGSGSTGAQIGGAWTGTLGLVTSKADYDWGTTVYGSPAHGPLLRTTNTAYAYQSNGTLFNDNLLNLPSSVTVYNGSGVEAASTAYGYDSTGDRTSTESWTGYYNALTSTAAFDSNGRVTSSTDAAGHTTTYSYAGTCYAGSGPTLVTDPMNLATSYCYDPNTGQETSVTDANNQTTTYAFDIMRRPTQTSFPDGGETTFNYSDTVGALSVETQRKMDNGGHRTDSFIDFDGLGRQTSSASLNGAGTWDRTDTCYNDLGETSFTSYPFQDASHSGGPNCSGTGDAFGYDGLGRLTTTTHSDGSVITRAYKANAVETTDEGNGSFSVSRISQTDGLGRLVSVCEVTNTADAAGNTPGDCAQTIDATGFLTSYGYDALGDLTNVTQGNEARSFNYDFLGRLLSATNPESGATDYAWDGDSNCGNNSAGDLASSTDARGIRTCYSYDADHRVTSKTYSDGTTPAVTFAYDQTSVFGYSISNPNGRLTSESAGSTAEAFSYDQTGRVVTNWQCFTPNCSAGAYPLNYGHDLAGDTTSASNGFGVYWYPTYNLEQQMSGLTSSLSDASHPGTLVSNLTYWPNGGLDTATLGNGVAETRSQDARGRVDSIADGSAYSVSIGHAPDGDVTSDTDSVNGAWAYGYDAQNRLASSSCTANCPDGAGAQAFSYTYDRYGNRWKQLVTAGSGPSPQFSFTANNNRMDGYSYDTAGDLLGDGAHAYAYDADHRLISVDNGSTASYSYNAAGQRATKTAGGVTHDYLYDLDGNMETEITNGGWSRGEVYAGGRRWASYANGTTYFEYSDWLDTARVNTQYGGGWTQTCQNDPFGDDLTCTGGTSPSPVHFTGKPRDGEDNLDYFGARYNASSLGRFMTPDWSAGDSVNPQSLNRYSFVLDNPVTLIDPTGMTATGASDSTGACLEDMGGCRVLPNGDCSIDGVTSFCDQAQVELEMGGALNCPDTGCAIVGQYFTSPVNGEPYRLIASDQGYQYIAINGEGVWPTDAWGELYLPQFSTGQGLANEFRLPYIPPPGPPRVARRPPPRPTAAVSNGHVYSRSYSAYLGCGIGMLSKNPDAAVTANGAPIFLLATGREALALRALAVMAAYDLGGAEVARVRCSQAVYGR